MPTEERIKWNVIIIVHLFAMQLKMNFVQAQQMVYIFSLLFSPFEIPQQEYLLVFFTPYRIIKVKITLLNYEAEH